MKKTTLALLMGLSLFGSLVMADEVEAPINGQTLTEVNALSDTQVDAQQAQQAAQEEAMKIAAERADKAAIVFDSLDLNVANEEFKLAVQASISQISNNTITVKEYFGGPEGFVGLLLEFNDGIMHRETITFVNGAGSLFVSGRLLTTELDYSTEAENRYVTVPHMTPVEDPSMAPPAVTPMDKPMIDPTIPEIGMDMPPIDALSANMDPAVIVEPPVPMENF